MLKSVSVLRSVALVVVLGFVAACSPEIVAKDASVVSPYIGYPDAHDFSLPMMN